ncbi:transporter substrate-binding domain-containing protein [Sanguibacter suaedae]|uniref:Transporter substrate-binding domain-containing protein n=1 Tax=Sanguibacter suaedae TaxID=2795737 RepID=A0A934IC27_9MICO|nr:transporter substrate-binding domain-containing protein [Sanguibacter suaedae]MBI9115035.1 transporter substrate-binding domain-containing protein [Sanguibacter suaedae]
MRKPRFIVPTIAAGVLVLAGCSSTDSGTSDDEGGLALVTDGQLTVCTNPPFEPFEFEQDGEIVGLDIAIAEEIATDLDVEVATVITPFEGIQSGAALNAGQCDLVASGITITPERQNNIDFSEPYFAADQGLLVPEGSDLSSIESLADANVGVMVETTGQAWALDNGLTVTEFDDLGAQVQALETGQVDAIVNDVATLTPFVSDGFELGNNFATDEEYGLGVKKGSTELLDAVNGTLERIQEDGTYDALYTEWIGTAPSEG